MKTAALWPAFSFAQMAQMRERTPMFFVEHSGPNMSVPRRGDEPPDFWSQSFCYGSGAIKAGAGKAIQIRFRNDGGKRYLRAEAHLIQRAGASDPLQVTYHWSDDAGKHLDARVPLSRRSRLDSRVDC